MRGGHLYRTTCTLCNSPGASVKYFIRVKVAQCDGCGRAVDLYPGYVLAADRRHPEFIVICPECGELNGAKERPAPRNCAQCGHQLTLSGPVRQGACPCPCSGEE